MSLLMKTIKEEVSIMKIALNFQNPMKGCGNSTRWDSELAFVNNKDINLRPWEAGC